MITGVRCKWEASCVTWDSSLLSSMNGERSGYGTSRVLLTLCFPHPTSSPLVPLHIPYGIHERRVWWGNKTCTDWTTIKEAGCLGFYRKWLTNNQWHVQSVENARDRVVQHVRHHAKEVEYRQIRRMSWDTTLWQGIIWDRTTVGHDYSLSEGTPQGLI